MTSAMTSAEFSANALQTIQPSASAIMTASPVPARDGWIYHRDESGLFRLASPALMGTNYQLRGCCCCGMPVAIYQVAFHGNIGLPTTGTLGEIQLALAVDGEIDPSSIMRYTPAALGTDFNTVGADILVAVPWICRCSTVSVRNITAQPVDLQNANIVFTFAGIRR